MGSILISHSPVVIVNDSFVYIKKVINCSSSHQALLFLNPLPSSLNPVTSQLTQSFFFLTEYLVSLGNTSHYRSDLTLMLTGAGVCCL